MSPVIPASQNIVSSATWDSGDSQNISNLRWTVILTDFGSIFEKTLASYTSVRSLNATLKIRNLNALSTTLLLGTSEFIKENIASLFWWCSEEEAAILKTSGQCSSFEHSITLNAIAWLKSVPNRSKSYGIALKMIEITR